jgi:hypothetical protein
VILRPRRPGVKNFFYFGSFLVHFDTLCASSFTYCPAKPLNVRKNPPFPIGAKIPGKGNFRGNPRAKVPGKGSFRGNPRAKVPGKGSFRGK